MKPSKVLLLLALSCLSPMDLLAAVDPGAVQRSANNAIFLQVLDVETEDLDEKQGSYQELITAEVVFTLWSRDGLRSGDRIVVVTHVDPELDQRRIEAGRNRPHGWSGSQPMLSARFRSYPDRVPQRQKGPDEIRRSVTVPMEMPEGTSGRGLTWAFVSFEEGGPPLNRRWNPDDVERPDPRFRAVAHQYSFQPYVYLDSLGFFKESASHNLTGGGRYPIWQFVRATKLRDVRTNESFTVADGRVLEYLGSDGVVAFFYDAREKRIGSLNLSERGGPWGLAFWPHPLGPLVEEDSGIPAAYFKSAASADRSPEEIALSANRLKRFAEAGVDGAEAFWEELKRQVGKSIDVDLPPPSWYDPLPSLDDFPLPDPPTE